MTSYEKRDSAIGACQEIESIEITTGMNGYPKDLHGGLIGFSSFALAEAVAKVFNGDVVLFIKREGWNFYESHGGVSKPIDVYACLQQVDDCFLYQPLSYMDEDEFYQEVVKPALEEADTFSNVEQLMNHYHAIYELLEKCDETHFVCDMSGQLEVMERESMRYQEDVWEYVVGVEFWKD